jgi:hypothetical protein
MRSCWEIGTINFLGELSEMNQNFDFKFVCENFQPKFINFYSNCQWFFIFYKAAWAVIGVDQSKMKMMIYLAFGFLIHTLVSWPISDPFLHLLTSRPAHCSWKLLKRSIMLFIQKFLNLNLQI